MKKLIASGITAALIASGVAVTAPAANGFTAVTDESGVCTIVADREYISQVKANQAAFIEQAAAAYDEVVPGSKGFITRWLNTINGFDNGLTIADAGQILALPSDNLESLVSMIGNDDIEEFVLWITNQAITRLTGGVLGGPLYETFKAMLTANAVKGIKIADMQAMTTMLNVSKGDIYPSILFNDPKHDEESGTTIYSNLDALPYSTTETIKDVANSASEPPFTTFDFKTTLREVAADTKVLQHRDDILNAKAKCLGEEPTNPETEGEETTTPSSEAAKPTATETKQSETSKPSASSTSASSTSESSSSSSSSTTKEAEPTEDDQESKSSSESAGVIVAIIAAIAVIGGAVAALAPQIMKML